MARVTVEDCLERIPNQFELTLVAAKRARQLARGAEAKLPWGDHKSTVLSLREIADNLVDKKVLEEADLPAIQAPKMELEALAAPGGVGKRRHAVEDRYGLAQLHSYIRI